MGESARISRRSFFKLRLVVASVSICLIALFCLMFYLLWNINVDRKVNATLVAVSMSLENNGSMKNYEKRLPKEIVKTHLMRLRNKLFDKVKKSTTQEVLETEEFLENSTISTMFTDPYTQIFIAHTANSSKVMKTITNEILQSTVLLDTTASVITRHPHEIKGNLNKMQAPVYRKVGFKRSVDIKDKLEEVESSDAGDTDDDDDTGRRKRDVDT